MPFRQVERAITELRHFGRALSGGSWRSGFRRAAILVVVLGVGAILYAWSGLVPLAASSGHSPITYWFLDFAKRNGVETQSTGTKVPVLDDPALVLKGAGHYATGCAPCHGAPGKERSAISRRMTPEPPLYSERFSRWSTEEMFWVVKHGIKFTGMPAWPAQQRDDEIWAVVSFLQELPELDARQYERLAYGEQESPRDEEPARNPLHALAEPVQSTLTDCARCHGIDGNGRGKGAFPKLAGQNAAYLQASLQAFASGERHSGIMQPAVTNLDGETLHALAGYYASLSRNSAGPTVADDVIEQGRRIARQGIAVRGIPACRHCHGPGTQRNTAFPELAGQYADYLVLQLGLFKSGTRGGTPYAHIMNTVTRRMTAEDMRAVAQYYASLADERKEETEPR